MRQEMSFIEDLMAMKNLANDICEEGLALARKYCDDTPREDIVNQLNGWINLEYIVTRSSQGSRSDVANAIKNGYLFPTSFAYILATDRDVHTRFERYITCGRIMDVSRLSVNKGLHTQHSIEKAIQKGEIEAVKSLGSSITLYID